MLNKRQKQLYEYLLEHEGETICKFQVVNHFEGAYAVEEKEKNSKSHKILDDVKALNRDETIEKIIIYKNNTLKIATEEEAKEYRNLFLKKAVMQFANYHALNKKIKSNGQGQLKEDKEELCEFIDRYEKEGGDKKKKK